MFASTRELEIDSVPVPVPATATAAPAGRKLSQTAAADPIEAERMRQFAARIDAIRARVEAEIGAEDVAHIKKVRAFSNAMQLTGRFLIHVSLDPVTFSLGVGALWLHKQLEATEIGHTALHGAFDKLPGAEAFKSKGFDWKTPIDEESWHHGHNVLHHQYTNVTGRDPDIHFGAVRLNERTPHETTHYFQLPIALWAASNFGAVMNLHFTGVEDILRRKGHPERFDILADDKPETVRAAWGKALRKYIPYYAKEYVLFPALAGPLFPKVLLGNWLSEVMRDLYSAATIFCGHVGEDVADYPEGTRAGGRGAWYKMQIESANDFEVPLPISMLCGALDLQIEHHMFPKFPTNRLREIAPEVKAVCAEFGVRYKTDTWPRTLGKVVRRLWKLSFPT
jgi:NADPH-dependent stearoyl-CoA 9-desaturase